MFKGLLARLQRKPVASIKDQTQELQATLQEALKWWMYYLRAQRLRLEASQRSKGELAGPAAPAAVEGHDEIEAL